MNDEVNNQDEKRRLDELGSLVDKYAQSRSLGMLLLLPIIAFNAILLVASIELAPKYGPLIGGRGFWILMPLVLFWVLFSSTYLPYRILKRFGNCFYEKEGSIELQKDKTPICTWIAYIVTFLGPAILNEVHMLSVRWALTISLASFGAFVLYLGKKHKEIYIGLVYGTLSLIAAVATAAGVQPIVGGKHSYFASLMLYLIGAGLITAVAVHLYNRKVVRKMKKIEPFDQQSEADTQ